MLNTKLNTFEQEYKSIEKVQSHDYLVFLSGLGFVNHGELKPLIGHFDPYLVVDQNILPVLNAGQGKMFILEGNFVSALQALNTAKELYIADRVGLDVNNEYRAYILYEFSYFYRKIKDNQLSKEYLSKASLLSNSPVLSKLIDIELLFHSALDENVDNLAQIQNRLEFFKVNNLFLNYSVGLKRLGLLYSKKGKTEDALRYFEKAYQISVSENLHYTSISIMISKSMLYRSMKEFETSLKILENLIPVTNSPYQISLILENIAAVHYLQKDYELAASNCEEALKYSQENRVFSNIIGQCFFLNRVYRDYLKTPDLTTKYSKIAYESAMWQVQMGLPLSGNRLKAIEQVIDASVVSTTSSASLNHENCFAFAVGKKWEEIKSIYFYNFIYFANEKYPVSKEFYEKLDIKRPTLYANYRRLKEKGYKLPDLRYSVTKYDDKVIVKSLQEYFSSIPEVSWKDVYQRFEKDLFTHLFKHYGYMKTKIARALDMNYAVVRKKTAFLK